MTRLLYVDPVGGVAGDMLLAALVDAGATFDVVRGAVEAVLPGRFTLAVDEVRRAGLRASYLRIGGGEEDLESRPAGALLAAVEGAPLTERVRGRARAVLERLIQAEAAVHGLDPSTVELHALGDDDTLLDVVGVAAALDALGIDRVLVGPIPIGSGILPGWRGHPAMPLPAPATLELLRGFELRGAGEGETVTPTGAAILAALGRPVARIHGLRAEAVGYGAGTRDPAGSANVVRVVVGEADDVPIDADPDLPASRHLALFEANVDDLSPELVADAVAALFAAGALDAWTTPIVMKKGRPAFLVSALCEPSAEGRVLEAFFAATSTFGVRRTEVRRFELERRIETVAVGSGTVRVKVGLLRGRVASATPEHDDVAAIAQQDGRPVRAVYEEAVAAAASIRLAPSGEAAR